MVFLLTVLGYFLYYYLRDTFYDSSTVWDYILPITIYKWLMGYYGHQYILCVSIVRPLTSIMNSLKKVKYG